MTLVPQPELFMKIVAMLVWMALVIYCGARGFFLKQTRCLSHLVGVVLVVFFAAFCLESLRSQGTGFCVLTPITVWSNFG